MITREEQISFRAAAFRRAIDTLDRSLFPEHLRDFPCGCCSDVSDLLASYLKDACLGQFDLVSASRGIVGSPTEPFETHAWLAQGNLIVDITADQFIGKEEGVIVINSSSWHESFRISECRSAGLQAVDGPVRRELYSFYELLVDVVPLELTRRDGERS